MFQVGDWVVFAVDGARGIVLSVNPQACHVIWEDRVCSWENVEQLSLYPKMDEVKPIKMTDA